ncbi:MAG: hypothetical protein AB8G11_00530 [Saprospiraceae bacterium]
MKNRFLFLVIVFLIPNFLIGQECAADLSKDRVKLESIVNNMTESLEKTSLNNLLSLFKSCVTKPELENIKNTYKSLRLNTPEAPNYKKIIEDVLERNNVSCITLGEQTHNIDIPFDKRLSDLMRAYDNLKTNTPNIYGSNHIKNYVIFQTLQEEVKKCEIDTNNLRQLNDSIQIAGFGDLTVSFQEDFKVLLQKIRDGKLKVTIQYNDVEELKEKIEGKEEDNEGTNWLLYLLILAGLAIISYFAYDYNKKKKDKEQKTISINEKPKQNNTNIKTQLSDANSKLQRKVIELTETITKLNNEISTKDAEIIYLKNKLKNIEGSSSKQKTYTKPKNKPSNYSQTVLYFATPNQNGEFTSKGQNDVKIGASLYKFFISKDKNTAEFEFFNHPTTFRAALDDPNRMMPVCKPINIFNPDARRIDTIKKGKAKKEGNKWKVTDKAQVKYV